MGSGESKFAVERYADWWTAVFVAHGRWWRDGFRMRVWYDRERCMWQVYPSLFQGEQRPSAAGRRWARAALAKRRR